MTLNITVVSPSAIHQSADFQISKTEKDGNGNWIELQPNSSKIVSLRYEKWSGFLTYCGIGLWNGKRTDEYAADWLASLPSSGTTFRDAVEKIRDQGTLLLAQVRQNLGEIKPHSFVLAGYEEGTPIYAVVSNYQSLSATRPLSERLEADMRSTTDIHVFVTGIPTAVSPERRRKLKHLVQIASDPNVIRHELAETNRLAAQSKEARNGISRSCLTYSLDPHGGGHGEVYGDVLGPVMPRSVMNGIDLGRLLSHLLKASPSAKFVQSAFATGRSSEAVTREHISCNLRFSSAPPKSDSRGLASIETLGSINDYNLSIHAATDGQWLVGQLRKPVGAARHAFVWPMGRRIIDLGTFGGPFSNAFSANDMGQVVGTTHVDQSATHAFLWQESDGMHDLGTLGGRDSVARSINGSCHVVGDSFVGGGDPKQEYQRAFIWTPQAGMINIGSQFEGWSRAFAINNNGFVLGWRAHGTIVCGFIWSAELGAIDIVGEEGRNFYPSALNDAGVVVGEGDDNFGKRRAFCWTAERGLRQLPAPEDFHPCDIDVHGNIIGNVYSRPWNRPFIYNAVTEEFKGLPFAEEHHTSVKAITNSGIIVGAASKTSWKHSHPLIWRMLPL